MKILLTGATGFVGGHLTRELEAGGHSVVPVSRRPGPGVDWSDEGLARGVRETDAVCHLAGESVLGRWSASKKGTIRSSRVETTRRLAELLAEKGSGALVQASAVGFYGDPGTAVIDEEQPVGTGFLAETCQEWEAAAQPARDAGVRVAAVRIGVVLGKNGGALKQMLTPFKLGLGGPLGSGRQPFPWIHVGDLTRLFRFLLESEDAAGVFNGTGPNPVSNAEFGRTLGRVLHRPAFLPVPAFALKLLLGEMASMLLEGQHALPCAAEAAGFVFEHPLLEGALRDLVGR